VSDPLFTISVNGCIFTQTVKKTIPKRGRLVEVLFATRAIEKRLGSHKARVREYGGDLAKSINRRLTQLDAAQNLAVLRTLPGRCHELTGDRRGQLAMDITTNLRLVFEPADGPPPQRPGGGLDWSRVTSVRIVEVTDYHGR
jgi:plasmid maintenance system killer protein